MPTVLNLLCAGAAQGVVEALEEAFAAATGATLHSRFGAVGALEEALLDGAPCDVLVTTEARVAALSASGTLRAAGSAPLGRVQTGIAVRDADPLPAVDSAAALRRALQAADRIYFPDPARSTAGIHFSGVLKALGIHDELAPRFSTFPNGATAMRELAATTAAAPIGCTQVTEIRRTAGVRVAGNLPPAFALATVYSAALASRTADAALAARFVALLTGDPSRDLRRAAGFELDLPGTSSPPIGVP